MSPHARVSRRKHAMRMSMIRLRPCSHPECSIQFPACSRFTDTLYAERRGGAGSKDSFPKRLDRELLDPLQKTDQVVSRDRNTAQGCRILNPLHGFIPLHFARKPRSQTIACHHRRESNFTPLSWVCPSEVFFEKDPDIPWAISRVQSRPRIPSGR